MDIRTGGMDGEAISFFYYEGSDSKTINGDRSRTTEHAGKVKQYCRKWAQKTGYPLLIVKNAGHNSNVDNPNEVNQRIKYFLERYGY